MKNKLAKLERPFFLVLTNVVIWYAFSIVTPPFVADYLGIRNVQQPIIQAAQAKVDIKTYAYNEQVPKDIIKETIISTATNFGVDADTMLSLAECESGYNNLAKNPKSTAKGVFQFIASTWDSTESGKKKISPWDYRSNIREAVIKIANGEYSHWKECLK